MCFRTVLLDNNPYALSCWNNTIATGLGSGDIVILDGITGSQVAVLSGHTHRVNSLTFSLDGTLLVSGSHDMTVKLWDVQTGGVIKTFHGHTNLIFSVSISPDCTTIASGSHDYTIRLWDIPTKECYRIIAQQTWVMGVSFSPTDPQHLISVSGGKIQWWDIAGHKIGPEYYGSCVVFSPDGTQFASCNGATVTVRSSYSGAILTEFHMDVNYLLCCCFSPDGRLIATAAGFTVYVWDITGSDPCLIKTFTGHTNSPTSLTFPSSSSLISASHDKSVKFWKVDTPLANSVTTDLEPVALASAPIKSIVLQAKERIAISSDSDGVVMIWDILTGYCKASFQTPARNSCKRDIQLVNNRVVLVWHADDKICIWDTENGELLQTVNAPGANFEDLKISGDGSKVFMLHPGFVEAWSIQTGEVVGKVRLISFPSPESLVVDGSRVWVHSKWLKTQGWDFGISGTSPIPLSNGVPNGSRLHFTGGIQWWDTSPCKIKDRVIGKEILWLPKRFVGLVDAKWDSQYLVAGYKSGEVLILDFNHVLHQ